MDKDVLIIIPAYNEEATIELVLQQLQLNCPDYDLLVVNDASTDNTLSIAKQNRKAVVLNLPVNLGIGGAVQTGMKYASRLGYNYVIQFDADGQHRSEDVSKLINLIKRGKYDVVIGSRFVGKNKMKHSDFLRRLGIRIFEYYSLLLIQKTIKDHTSGFRAYNKHALDFIVHEYPVDYPEPEIAVMLVRNGFQVKEVFTQMYSRQGGLSSISIVHGPYYMTKVMLSMFMAVIRAKESHKN